MPYQNGGKQHVFINKYLGKYTKGSILPFSEILGFTATDKMVKANS